MDLEDRLAFAPNSIVKITTGDSVTLALVVDSTESEVLIFRDTGNIWLNLEENIVELLDVAD